MNTNYHLYVTFLISPNIEYYYLIQSLLCICSIEGSPNQSSLNSCCSCSDLIMSSSQPGTDLFLSSDISTPEGVCFQLEKIGHSQQYFKWTPEVHLEFTNWWATTDWCLENLGRGEKAVVIHWESKTRTSDS